MLNDFAIGVKSENVDASGLLTRPSQVTDMHESEIAINRHALDLTWDAPCLPDISHDALYAVREDRIVLDIWCADKARQEMRLSFVEDLPIDCVEHLADVFSRHGSVPLRC